MFRFDYDQLMAIAVKVAVTLGLTVVLLSVQLPDWPAAIADAVMEYPVGKPPCKTVELPTVEQSRTGAPLEVAMLRAA